MIDPADTLRPELEDDVSDLNVPGNPITEPVTTDTIPIEGILAMPFLQKAMLASIVVVLLVFVLRQRRRSNLAANEKSLA